MFWPLEVLKKPVLPAKTRARISLPTYRLAKITLFDVIDRPPLKLHTTPSRGVECLRDQVYFQEFDKTYQRI
ncbi:hypothetical protein [Lunatibacter salilacus]|uniref:hypothetical protein n=1 Tax=Lunatibacter salilacus TaxID=2483804 RepID=UPI00131B6712|nr:hypothetical protein [Lunatibacter salilacus]